ARHSIDSYVFIFTMKPTESHSLSESSNMTVILIPLPEVSPPLRGRPSSQRWPFLPEVALPPRGGPSSQRWPLLPEVAPPPRGGPSSQRWPLPSEVAPSLRGGPSSQRGSAGADPL
uniref:Uncharacterized protein n=1 Tax=Gadus morhua TaxID=8049 RepID=A0A8C5BS96_GADMO